ncbi:MAG: hypothetical protein ABEJ95_06810 [Candidatus Nanohalobium sp.]
MSLLDNIQEKPSKSALILTVLLFWMLAPLAAQKYLNYSAINVSFVITVCYFITWKLYEHQDKLQDYLP